jgi:hypothetical protein
MGHAIRHVPILIRQAFAKLVILVTTLVFAEMFAIRIAPILTGAIVMRPDQLAVQQILARRVVSILA